MEHKLTISVTGGLWKVSWSTNAGTVVLTFNSWDNVNLFVGALKNGTELDTYDVSDR